MYIYFANYKIVFCHDMKKTRVPFLNVTYVRVRVTFFFYPRRNADLLTNPSEEGMWGLIWNESLTGGPIPTKTPIKLPTNYLLKPSNSVVCMKRAGETFAGIRPTVTSLR